MSQSNQNQPIPSDRQATTKEQVDFGNYDRNIMPAETAARHDREGSNFKSIPTEEQTDPNQINTTAGYTVDNEGLVNNFAVEPEMYVDEPGDLREKGERGEAERTRELKQLQKDSQGELTMEEDKRGKGQGVI
ncbi:MULTISPECIES: hypothetical protein [unclassified Coleofasciculus]|uniref:hypothetical protein n=1 Tax=unclassified Coleofasciculus TaxID=2692782 RepID=UPI00187EC78E|nr:MULTISPECIES: hypothetical protein [unclassified Coleofasciculus]MBE9125647.1 hypothetical protein [Coleofasciculus sp. LEGE 07081]MBE9148801.1 hypothetical protein [Coleofasciculus sp. LEGE 07092]